MPKPFDLKKREDLIAQAAEVLARTGVIDTSLRALAAEMGTSARMLVYYFGSKEKLILAVLNRQRHQLVPLLQASATAEELRQRFWNDWQAITRGEQQSSGRILAQVLGAACGRDSPYSRHTADTLAQLTHSTQLRMEAIGMPTAMARTRAHLALAAIQGLIIDYFTTNDPSRVDDTYQRLIDDLVLAPYEPIESPDGIRKHIPTPRKGA